MMITLLLYVLIFSMICQTQAQKWNSTCYVHSSQIMINLGSVVKNLAILQNQ